ncbi:hypothetical protein FB451DRAFT_1176479 [Mycena latifolia]|nr:hypothetical protein FB451DRAFT_1176479 [Mycena latifolia]
MPDGIELLLYPGFLRLCPNRRSAKGQSRGGKREGCMTRANPLVKAAVLPRHVPLLPGRVKKGEGRLLHILRECLCGRRDHEQLHQLVALMQSTCWQEHQDSRETRATRAAALTSTTRLQEVTYDRGMVSGQSKNEVVAGGEGSGGGVYMAHGTVPRDEVTCGASLVPLPPTNGGAGSSRAGERRQGGVRRYQTQASVHNKVGVEYWDAPLLLTARKSLGSLTGPVMRKSTHAGLQWVSGYADEMWRNNVRAVFKMSSQMNVTSVRSEYYYENFGSPQAQWHLDIGNSKKSCSGWGVFIVQVTANAMSTTNPQTAPTVTVGTAPDTPTVAVAVDSSGDNESPSTCRMSGGLTGTWWSKYRVLGQQQVDGDERTQRLIEEQEYQKQLQEHKK